MSDYDHDAYARKRQAELRVTGYILAAFSAIGLLATRTDWLIPKILAWIIVALMAWAIIRIAVRTWRDWRKRMDFRKSAVGRSTGPDNAP